MKCIEGKGEYKVRKKFGILKYKKHWEKPKSTVAKSWEKRWVNLFEQINI